jgi:PncC family amidohydrolase
VGQLLITRGLSLAVAESVNGGLLIHILASTPQTHCFFRGGLLTPSDKVKIALGLDPGLLAGNAIMEATATAMAFLVRSKMEASIGIGLEGQAEKMDNVMMGKVFVAIDSPQTEKPVVRNY